MFEHKSIKWFIMVSQAKTGDENRTVCLLCFNVQWKESKKDATRIGYTQNFKVLFSLF